MLGVLGYKSTYMGRSYPEHKGSTAWRNGMGNGGGGQERLENVVILNAQTCP